MLPIQTLQRHEKAIYSLALWHDTLYSGSEDMEIKVRQMKLFSQLYIALLTYCSYTNTSDYSRECAIVL